jgi:uridylate kinase
MTQNGTQHSPYQRVLLKLSGEAFAPNDHTPGVDARAVEFIAQKVKAIYDLGIQVAVVVGGGNLWRGKTGEELGMDRTTADHMGMIATVMNGLALRDGLERIGTQARVQTAIQMNEIAEPYIRLRSIRHLEKGRVVILAGGLGNPFFTTDTAAALRASEIKADILIKATKVDGVYTADPKKDPTATRYETISFAEVIQQRLNIMDMTAFTLCEENGIKIMIVNFWEGDDLQRAMQGDHSVGTVIS